MTVPAAFCMWALEKQLEKRQREAQARQAIKTFEQARERVRNRVWPRRSCWERLLDG